MTKVADDATNRHARPPIFRTQFRDRRHPMLAAAAYAIALLIGLASWPVLFVVTDHILVVEWINAAFDLAGL